MTRDEFKSLEVGDRIVFNDGCGTRSAGEVIAYTGVQIRFDDGVKIAFEFRNTSASNFEMEEPKVAEQECHGEIPT